MAVTTNWVRVRRLMATGVAGAGLAALAVGVLPAGAAAPDKTVSASYNCTVSVLTYSLSYAVTASVTATAPATVAPGAKVSVSHLQTTLTVPASFVNEALSFGAGTISGTLTTADITATDAKVALVNTAGTGVAIPTLTLVSGQALNVELPPTPAKVGPWTAKKAGTMKFSTGEVAATLKTTSKIGPLTVSLNCAPNPAAVIGKTTVS